MDTAPFFAEIAGGPDGGHAAWVRADDGVRLRIGAWPVADARGTIILFPGRTEFIEKYGRAAADLGARGYGMAAIDWRGQGLSDRLTGDAMTGDVGDFQDYQKDVAALMRAAGALDLPRPWHLLAHSMGGAIGLRAAAGGLPVASAAFSAPMWGIRMRAALRPLAWSLGWGSQRVGLGHKFAPSTGPKSYMLSEPFESNDLTRDAEMHAHMVAQLTDHPELSLGGPSLRWLFGALQECRRLHALPSPDLPCLTIVGTDERIVDVPRIKARIARWPGARLEWLNGARHEPMMDRPETRQAVWDMLERFWTAHS
ncbi:alpha/beta fold hydrolase [Roseovarius nanhaiticus]|uniref:alpha/beta fold hydrolase n=1 Tax=Roseovarius nanhaiticus TaxID=573024 RepID=UPI00249114E2|nr:alpha/beta hydrolase [Roseovarius nanhaiticus]